MNIVVFLLNIDNKFYYVFGLGLGDDNAGL